MQWLISVRQCISGAWIVSLSLAMTLLLSFAAKAEPFAPAYQYQCLPNLGVIQVQKLPYVSYSTLNNLADKPLSERENIFFASEYTEFVETPELTQGLSRCCQQGKKDPLIFECEIDGKNYTTEINAVPYNPYPTRRCGAASPYIRVTVTDEEKTYFDRIPFSSTDTCSDDHDISSITLNIHNGIKVTFDNFKTYRSKYGSEPYLNEEKLKNIFKERKSDD